ncbi:MAG: LysM peptidoglycan-binding domain-containing protein [Paludibacter sp.]|nr:LysM peptidoglycan-binding domain-containing protein [Paludibacter sp.]
MKKQLFHLILASCLLITNFILAQKNDYPTKKVNGTDYYIYTVEASEGLYAIGRKFDVTLDEITIANPEVKDGLKLGQTILIPIHKNQTSKSENTDNLKFIEHKVEKKQTLFAISRLYNISQEDIIKYNPDVEEGLQTGSVLKIPVAKTNKKTEIQQVEKTITEPIKSPEKLKLKRHIVLAKETLYSISKLYNVEIDKIVELNPGVDKNLNIGTELIIPDEENNIKHVATTQDKTVNKPTASISFDNIFKIIESAFNSEDSKTLRIAFLLPFMLDSPKYDASTDRFVNFYAGSLLALKEAKENGASFQVYTYDTGKTEDKLMSVLSNDELKSMDMIIGPAYSNQVSMMANFAKNNKIKTLIPFSSKIAEIDQNPYLFQFNPGTDSELKFSTELLNGKYKKLNLVFVEIPDINYFDDGKLFTEKLKKNLSNNKREFSMLNINSSDNVDFSKVIKKGVKNLIIFNTDKFAYVSPYMAALKDISINNDVTLFEQYSWKDQPEKIAQGIRISPFASTMDQAQLSSFNQKFSNIYNWNVSIDTPRYDILGYDITSYFILFLKEYGNKLPEKLSLKNNSNWIQSQPEFQRTSEHSGFINQQLYLTEDKKY